MTEKSAFKKRITSVSITIKLTWCTTFMNSENVFFFMWMNKWCHYFGPTYHDNMSMFAYNVQGCQVSVVCTSYNRWCNKQLRTSREARCVLVWSGIENTSNKIYCAMLTIIWRSKNCQHYNNNSQTLTAVRWSTRRDEAPSIPECNNNNTPCTR